MASGLETKIQYVTTGALNTVNDPTAGGGVANFAGGNGRCPGALGSVVYLETSDPKFYDPSVGTLYPGGYQRVQLVSTSTASAVRGGIAYWVDPTSATAPYQVTADATDGAQAGIFLNALTKGNYGYIQVEGVASVLFANPLTKTGAAKDDMVFCSSGAGTADVILDATDITAPILKRALGVATAAPAAGAVSTVDLKPQARNQ